jgi:indole-3-pyruvate monooxygenase
MEKSGDVEEYSGRFLVVATGETTDPFIPNVDGLSSFKGDVIHSTEYKCGQSFSDKHVLVVGSGNSGMEIALDLSEYNAKTSIAVRSPVHVLSKGMVYMGLILLKHIPLYVVDYMMIILSKITYGDLTKYGIQTPKEGPFASKVKYGKYPVIDAGTCQKIKKREIQVLPAIRSIRGNDVEFEDGKSHTFHTIVFATGFTRSTTNWLQDDEYLLNKEGLAKAEYPNHWKGKNGLYCVGLARRGLYGAAMDALNIANHINTSSII